MPKLIAQMIAAQESLTLIQGALVIPPRETFAGSGITKSESDPDGKAEREAAAAGGLACVQYKPIEAYDKNGFPTLLASAAGIDPYAVMEDEGSSSSGSGLNAGSELDEEFETPVEFVAPEPPALEDCVNLALTLEARIQDLGYLVEAIQHAGGMTREFALEGEKLLPGFGGVPAGYYTERPTVTRLRVSMEEIHKGVWALIAAGAAALIALIVKLFHWLSKEPGAPEEASSSGTPQVKAEAALERAAVRVEEMPEIIERVTKITDKADGMLHNANLIIKNDQGVEKHCTTLQQVIDHLFVDEERYGRAKRLLLTPEPVLQDLIDRGPYSQRVIAMGGKIRMIDHGLRARLDGLDEVVRRDLNSSSPSDSVKNILSLTSLNTSITISIDSRQVELGELAGLISRERGDLLSHPTSKTVRFDALFQAMLRCFNDARLQQTLRDISKSMGTIAELEKRVEKLQSVARDLSTDGYPGAVSQDTGTAIRQVILKTSQDLANYATLCGQIKLFTSQLEHYSREVVAFSRELVRKVSVELRKNGQEVPPAWDDVVRDLNDELKSISKAYFSMH